MLGLPCLAPYHVNNQVKSWIETLGQVIILIYNSESVYYRVSPIEREKNLEWSAQLADLHGTTC